MKFPKLITDLVAAQNNHDAVAYASLFAENAEVVDEGQHHIGRAAIHEWIKNANEQYQTTLNRLVTQPMKRAPYLQQRYREHFLAAQQC